MYFYWTFSALFFFYKQKSCLHALWYSSVFYLQSSWHTSFMRKPGGLFFIKCAFLPTTSPHHPSFIPPPPHHPLADSGLSCEIFRGRSIGTCCELGACCKIQVYYCNEIWVDSTTSKFLYIDNMSSNIVQCTWTKLITTKHLATKRLNLEQNSKATKSPNYKWCR